MREKVTVQRVKRAGFPLMRIIADFDKTFPTLDYAPSLEADLDGVEPVWAAELVHKKLFIDGHNVLLISGWQHAE